MRLVATPSPLATECVTGYLHTLCSANGYPRPSFLLTGLVQHSRKNGYRQVTPKMLRAMAGLSEAVAGRLCLDAKVGSRTTVRLLEQEVHTSELRMDTFRICPLCIADQGRHQAAWHLKLVNWCSRHHVRLLEACTACGQRLEWNRPALDQCPCGADLTAQSAPEPDCSSALAALTAVIEAALYQRPELRPVPPPMTHLEHLSIYALSRLVFVLVEQLPSDGPSIVHGRRRDRPLTAGQLEYVAKILDDWPAGFQQFLAEHYTAAVQSDVLGNGFRRAFYWALHTLDNAERTMGTTEFSFLREQVYRFGAQFLPRERLVRGDRVRLPIANAWASVLEAAAEIKMDPRTLIKRIQSGEVPAIEADYRRRNRNLLVDMQWLRRWKISQYAPVHERDAAETAGISVSLLRALRKAGIYESRFHSRRIGGFSEEDVSRFSDFLARLAARYSVDGTPGGITMDGINLRTTKSVERRVELLGDLKRKHPHMWPADDSGDTTTEETVEVQVDGHRPVIVRCDCNGGSTTGLVARYPGGAGVSAGDAAEMVEKLVAIGLKRKDIAVAGPGDGDRGLSDSAKQDFLTRWDDEWRRLKRIEDELNDAIPGWEDRRRVRKYLWNFEGRDVDKLEAAKELLGVWYPVWGERVYPRFQFDGKHLKERNAELLRLLPEDPKGWRQIRWLCEPNDCLGNRLPIEVAEEDIGAVIEAASRAFHRWSEALSGQGCTKR